MKLHLEIFNLNKEELEIQLSFWDGFGNMLWNFMHQNYNLPPLPKQEKLHVSIRFSLPEIVIDEIFVHLGLSKAGESFYGLTDHVINALSINVDRGNTNIKSTLYGIFKSDAELKIH